MLCTVRLRGLVVVGGGTGVGTAPTLGPRALRGFIEPQTNTNTV